MQAIRAPSPAATSNTDIADTTDGTVTDGTASDAVSDNAVDTTSPLAMPPLSKSTPAAAYTAAPADNIEDDKTPVVVDGIPAIGGAHSVVQAFSRRRGLRQKEKKAARRLEEANMVQQQEVAQ